MPDTVSARELVAYHNTYGRFPISSDPAGEYILNGGNKTINNDITLYIQVYNLRKVSFSTLIEITSNTDQDVYYTNGKAITTGNIIYLGDKKYKKLGDSYISTFGINYDYGILTGAGNLDIPNKVVSEGGSLYFGYKIPSGYGTSFNFDGFYASDESTAQTSSMGSYYREFRVGSGTGNIEYYVAFTPKTYTVIYDNDVSDGKIGTLTIPSTMTTKPTHETRTKTYSIGTKYTFEETIFEIEGFTLSGFSKGTR